MTDELFTTSSPVFTIDGEDVGELARDIVHLHIDHNVDGLKRLRARFVALGPASRSEHGTLLYLDGQQVDFGKTIKVSIGPPSQQRFVFDGLISAMEIQYDEGEEPEFCLYAEDKLMHMRMTRRARTYTDMSDADIATELANEHGLVPNVDVEGPTYDLIQQANMSDLAFLRERARLLQAEIWVEGDDFYMQTRDRREATSVTLTRGTDLISVKACADLAHQRTSVRVCSYDANAREVIDEVAEEDALDSEITNGKSGVAILKTAMGDFASHRVREVPVESQEAADWARAELLRRGRSFVTVNSVTHGTPDLMVGSLITLEQMGTPFDGEGYYATQVEHTYDLSSGHRPGFEATRATVSEGK